MRLLFTNPDKTILAAEGKVPTMEIEIYGSGIVAVGFKDGEPDTSLGHEDIEPSAKLRWSVQADGVVRPDLDRVREIIRANVKVLRRAFRGFDIYGRDGRDRGVLTPEATAAYRQFESVLKTAEWTT